MAENGFVEKPTIVVIDDEAIQRKTLADILRAKGYEVLTAESGSCGLTLMRDNAVNLALIDLGLPDIPGLTVLERMRAEHPIMEAIILTGNATLDSAIEAANSGAFSYLVKPFEIERLLVTLKRAIEKQQAREKLRSASQYARSLIEASLDPLVTISPEGKITDVNEATVSVTGIPRDQLIGTDFSDYFTDAEKAREGYRQVFANGLVTDYLLTIRHSDGRLIDVLYNASLYRDPQGNVLGVFAAARDVTESRRIMHDFIETKNFLDNILQSSTKYSIIGVDLNHRILSWNEGARRNYGYSEVEIAGKKATVLYGPEDIYSGVVDKVIQEAYEKGIAEGEFQRVRKDGSCFVANVVITRRNDPAGNPVGYLIMSTDITEKKRVEETMLRHDRELERVNADLQLHRDVSIAIAKTMDLQELLSEVLHVLANSSILFLEPTAAVFLVEEDRLKLVSHLNFSPCALRCSDLRVGQCICGLAAMTGDVTVSSSSIVDPHHSISCDQPEHGHIAVPLKSVDRILGVVMLKTKAFAEVDDNMVRLLSSLGNHIAVAVNNAKLYEEAKNNSLQDTLTGLANRRALQMQLTKSIEAAKRYNEKLSVIMLDIDHFKDFNDKYGHVEGDRLLVRMAGIILHEMRSSDHVFRYGGEEFLVLLPQTDLNKACEVAERVRKSVEVATGVTISLGVSSYHEIMWDDEGLIKTADAALYQAKQKGRNRVVASV